VSVVAGTLASLAVWLLARPRPRPTSRAGVEGRRTDRVRRTGLWVGPLTGGCVAMVAFLDGARLVLAVILLGCLVGGAFVVRRGRESRRRRERRIQVVELSEVLVGELRSGRPTVAALRRGADIWPRFGPVASAAELGADVPAALRRAAEDPGLESLGDVAAAWQVSQRTGSSLAVALDQVAATARAELAASRLVASELASAQATARLVALLPIGTLAMSAGIGGDPWGFLLGHPAGLACLAAGVALILVGLRWIDGIAASVVRR
jgi:tight adherence protein B